MTTFRPLEHIRRRRGFRAGVRSRRQGQRALHDAVRRRPTPTVMRGSGSPPPAKSAAPSFAIAPSAWPASCSATTSRPREPRYRRRPTPRISRCAIPQSRARIRRPRGASRRTPADRHRACLRRAAPARPCIRAYKYAVFSLVHRRVPVRAVLCRLHRRSDRAPRPAPRRAGWAPGGSAAVTPSAATASIRPDRRAWSANPSTGACFFGASHSSSDRPQLNGTSRPARHLAVLPGAVRCTRRSSCRSAPPDAAQQLSQPVASAVASSLRRCRKALSRADISAAAPCSRLRPWSATPTSARSSSRRRKCARSSPTAARASGTGC